MTSDLELRLVRARERMDSVDYVDRAAWYSAWDELLDAERELARSRGHQYAEVVDLGLRWDTGAPLPHVVSNGIRAFVVCHLGDSDPNWDGASVTVVSPTDEHESAFAILDLWGLRSIRFGMPNDEALEGHPLWGSGLRAYEAHRVINSAWLEEHIRWNSVHSSHSDATWRELDHYLLAFHDDMIEALALGIEATPARGTPSSLLRQCLDRLIEEPTRR